jgi:hypothetical protein
MPYPSLCLPCFPPFFSWHLSLQFLPLCLTFLKSLPNDCFPSTHSWEWGSLGWKPFLCYPIMFPCLCYHNLGSPQKLIQAKALMDDIPSKDCFY